MSKLNHASLEELFNALDKAATQLETGQLCFTLIGSSVLIQDGMPERATIDIDFWKVQGADKDKLRKMAMRAGILFDPDDYSNEEDPYLQVVWPGHVHMPTNERWQEQTTAVWRGKQIEFRGPPLGVILGSKLAAGREKDLVDVEYIVNKHPDWEQQLDVWIGDFSEEHQESIRENLVFAQIASRRVPGTRPKP